MVLEPPKVAGSIPKLQLFESLVLPFLLADVLENRRLITSHRGSKATLRSKVLGDEAMLSHRTHEPSGSLATPHTSARSKSACRSDRASDALLQSGTPSARPRRFADRLGRVCPTQFERTGKW